MEMKRDTMGDGVAGIAPQFSASLLDESACRRLVIECLHGVAPRCPGCQEILSDRLIDHGRWRAGQRVRCRGCDRTMSYTSGTVLDGLHITPAELVLFLALNSFALPRARIATIMQRDPGTIGNWRRRLIDRVIA